MRKLKILSIMMLFMASTVVFSSCSDDEDEPKFDSQYAKEIIGTWKVFEYGRPNLWSPWRYSSTTATFYSDGTYSGKGYFGTGEGNYNLSGKNITCYIDGEVYMRYEIYSLEEDIAVLKVFIGTAPNSNMYLKCRKL